MRKKSQEGFTLIELMVVIAIISIFASVVIGVLSQAREKAYDAKVSVEMKTVQNALEAYYADNGSYPRPGDDPVCIGASNCILAGVSITTMLAVGNSSLALDNSSQVAGIFPAMSYSRIVTVGNNNYRGYVYVPCSSADALESGGCPYDASSIITPTTSAVRDFLVGSYTSNGYVATVYGCTDSNANNYNSNATSDDGSCSYEVLGCTNSSATNYNSNATIDDGSCNYGNYGCTDPSANNYNSSATSDDGSCTYSVYGCTDSSANNYNPSATSDDGSCTYGTYGCTDSNAVNFNPSATIDDGSCSYIIYGCTDSTASNYNSSANADDGSCMY